MSDATRLPDDMPKSDHKGWRVLLEFIFAGWTTAFGMALYQDRVNLPQFVGVIATGLIFTGGVLFVLHGVDCIRWRRQVAEFWASAPGGSWFSKDPIRDHVRRVVPAGIISVLIGCFILFVLAAGIAKSIMA